MIIRPEQPPDYAQIAAITDAAFAQMRFSSGRERLIIEQLRTANALSLSLVAEVEGQLVGHVAFSPATAADGSRPWFALGPVAVSPPVQRQGIGSALINRGLEMLVQDGALGCILVGNPNYYQRFGFVVSPAHAPPNQPAEYFMLKRFGATGPVGTLSFHTVFDK